MKAPDKIYVVPDFIEGLSLERKDYGDEICFIRKDALIEILQGYSHPLTKLVMQEIIDKINSL